MAYALDDAVETLGVGAILAPPYFAQAQLLPFDYQSAVLRGSAAKVDTLLVRDYLAAGHAIPTPRPVQPVGGGLTAIWQQGVGGPVLHVDVTSLYPSLMVGQRVAPHLLRAAGVPPATKTARNGENYEVGHANFVFAYTKDNLAHVIYPGGVTQQDWLHDLPQLVQETWSSR